MWCQKHTGEMGREWGHSSVDSSKAIISTVQYKGTEGICLCIYVHVLRLTWTLLDTEGSVGVFCPGVVFQLEAGGVVDKWLRALGHACPAVVEVGAGLRTHGVEEQLFRFITLVTLSKTHVLTYLCGAVQQEGLHRCGDTVRTIRSLHTTVLTKQSVSFGP